MSIQADQAGYVGPAASESDEVQNLCPVDHTAFSSQKTARAARQGEAPLEQGTAGIWHARGHEEARAILRSGDTKQAGFKAELLERIPARMNRPILYQEGKTHQS